MEIVQTGITVYACQVLSAYYVYIYLVLDVLMFAFSLFIEE